MRGPHSGACMQPTRHGATRARPCMRRRCPFDVHRLHASSSPIFRKPALIGPAFPSGRRAKRRTVRRPCFPPSSFAAFYSSFALVAAQFLDIFFHNGRDRDPSRPFRHVSLSPLLLPFFFFVFVFSFTKGCALFYVQCSASDVD